MTFDKLKKRLNTSLDSKDILVPKERVFDDRRQGCWSCKHWSVEEGKKLWNVRRQDQLSKALAMSLEANLGEEDHRVIACRRAVDTFDNSVAAHVVGLCSGAASEDANGNRVEFSTSTYLCHGWTAHVGAKEEFTKADPTAQELKIKLGD